MKVIIPTKEQMKEAQKRGYWFHFAERLKQRYGIDVSFERYLTMIKEEVESIKHLSSHKRLGWLTIEGKRVLVVKERWGGRYLITALPIHSNKIQNK